MKKITFALLLCLFSVPVFADEPCPSEADEAKPVDPNEKCKPNLDGDYAPVVFAFPDDKKKENKPAQADESHKNEAPKADSPKKQDESNLKPAARIVPKNCTYSAYAWDTKKGKTTNHFDVSKPYDEVTDDERDPNVPECTICREDQVLIDPHDIGISLPPIRICHVYAEQVKNALAEINSSGKFDIEKLEGYRPGKTRGAVDKDGLRTQWSQHSFGTAIDINSHRNAIYSGCPAKLTGKAEEVKNCRRGIGGDWKPEKQPRVSIVKDGVVYKAMTQFWKWGGEIDGSTKDIMHFSVTGY